ncbi:MAG: DUF6483 family protein [Clostridiaceae bacterium]
MKDDYDWMMSQVKNIGRGFAAILFRKKETKNIYFQAETSGDDMGNKKRILRELVSQGNLNEAENQIFEWKFNNEANALTLAMWFYGTIQKMTDEELKKYNFSRDEIREGMLEMFNEHPLNSIQDMEKPQ